MVGAHATSVCGVCAQPHHTLLPHPPHPHPVMKEYEIYASVRFTHRLPINALPETRTLNADQIGSAVTASGLFVEVGSSLKSPLYEKASCRLTTSSPNMEWLIDGVAGHVTCSGHFTTVARPSAIICDEQHTSGRPSCVSCVVSSTDVIAHRAVFGADAFLAAPFAHGCLPSVGMGHYGTTGPQNAEAIAGERSAVGLSDEGNTNDAWPNVLELMACQGDSA